MSDKDDIRELKHDVEELKDFKIKVEIDQRVKKGVENGVRAKCALAWGWIVVCAGVAFSLLTLYSDTVKLASKAALKVIITRIWE